MMPHAFMLIRIGIFLYTDLFALSGGFMYHYRFRKCSRSLCARSSARIERQIAVLKVRGSNPLGRTIFYSGEVAERLKATVSKTVVRETVPGVQISPSPPKNPVSAYGAAELAIRSAAGIPFKRGRRCFALVLAVRGKRLSYPFRAVDHRKNE